MDKVTCHECEQETRMATGAIIEGQEVWLCGVCNGDHDPCQQCDSIDVVYDDYGVTLCRECKDNQTPQQRVRLYEQEYYDALESGNPIADVMPMPSSW